MAFEAVEGESEPVPFALHGKASAADAQLRVIDGEVLRVDRDAQWADRVLLLQEPRGLICAGEVDQVQQEVCSAMSFSPYVFYWVAPIPGAAGCLVVEEDVAAARGGVPGNLLKVVRVVEVQPVENAVVLLVCG